MVPQQAIIDRQAKQIAELESLINALEIDINHIHSLREEDIKKIVFLRVRLRDIQALASNSI